MKNNTKKLAVSSVMTALAVILSFAKIYELPYGGAVTLFSMVPVIFVGYAFGAKWGIASGLVFGITDCIMGASSTLAYLTDNVLSFTLCLLFDYLVAFAVIGISGVFKNKLKNEKTAFGLGAAFSVFLRFVCHFITGWFVWGGYAEDTLSVNEFGQKILDTFSGQALAVVYSLVYNGSYMIPEIILSAFAAVALISIKPISKLAKGLN